MNTLVLAKSTQRAHYLMYNDATAWDLKNANKATDTKIQTADKEWRTATHQYDIRGCSADRLVIDEGMDEYLILMAKECLVMSDHKIIEYRR